MLGAPIVLRYNEHVRVDIVYGKLARNGPVYVDLFGLIFFLLPVMGVLCIPLGVFALSKDINLYSWFFIDPHTDHSIEAKLPLFTKPGWFVTMTTSSSREP